MEPYLALVSPPHILTQSPALSHHQLHLTDPDFHKFIIYIFILFIMFINIFFLYLYIDTISGPLPPSQLQPTDPFFSNIYKYAKKNPNNHITWETTHQPK